MSGCRGPSWPDAEVNPGSTGLDGIPGTRRSLNSLGQVLESSRRELRKLET